MFWYSVDLWEQGLSGLSEWAFIYSTAFCEIV